VKFEFGVVNEGVIASGQVVPGADLAAIFESTLAARKDQVAALLDLARQYLRQEPIYVRIEDGARKGSIAKLSREHLALKRKVPVDQHYTGRKVISSGESEDGLTAWYLESGWGSNVMTIHVARSLELSGHEGSFTWDDRPKSVMAQYNELHGMTVLPGYKGPTVYQFQRAPSLTKAEKAALAAANAIAIHPLDMFGQKLNMDDMFIYARRDELVIARLKKVSESGYITAQTILDSKMVKLQGQEAVRCIREKKPVMSLMRFERDENLSQKLMVEKLRANYGGVQ